MVYELVLVHAPKLQRNPVLKNQKRKKSLEPGVMVHAFSTSAWKAKDDRFLEFEASLVYRANAWKASFRQ